MGTFTGLVAALTIVAVAVAWRMARRAGRAGGRGWGGRAARGVGVRAGRGRWVCGPHGHPTASLPLGGGDRLVELLGPPPRGWTVLTDVPTLEGAVPMVALGPTGLWAVAWVGAKGTVSGVEANVTLDGRETDVGSALWRRGHALADGMAVHLGGEAPVLQGLLVFDPARVRLDKREVMGIRLALEPELGEIVLASRVRLDPATLDDLREALSRYDRRL